MATAPARPPWFGNRGVQVLAVVALGYSLVQMVSLLVDGDWGEAFLRFAFGVLFGYVLLESLRFRRSQDAARQEPTEPGD